MKVTLFLISLVLISATGFSQTKRIAHRSHSGHASTFTINSVDNFGETPEMMDARKNKEAEKKRLDSLAKKALADSLARLGNLNKSKEKEKAEKEKEKQAKEMEKARKEQEKLEKEAKKKGGNS